MLIGPEESVKDYIETDDTRWLDPEKTAGPAPRVETLYIGAGKKEKLSKGDILGFLVKQCGLEPSQIGAIDVRDHYSLTAVRDADMAKLLAAAKAGKIKGSRRQVSIM